MMTTEDVKNAGGIVETFSIEFSEDGNRSLYGVFQRSGEGTLSLRAIRVDKEGVPVPGAEVQDSDESDLSDW